MSAYRSAAAGFALAWLCACAPTGPPSPQGWTKIGSDLWAETSAGANETYRYSSAPTQGSLSDLASAQAVDTVERYPGSRLIRSVPFVACPGEAGLATYSLRRARLLEVAFSVDEAQAVVVQYERPVAVADAPAAIRAIRQAVCFAL
jgi:hypothetical protein